MATSTRKPVKPKPSAVRSTENALQPGESASADAAAPKRQEMRQAVVIVHGMGEQMPMETLRSFADAVWRDNPDLKGAVRSSDTWVNPTGLTGSREMRRVVAGGIRATQDGSGEAVLIQTDFYEFYWADCVTGTSLDQFNDWFQELVFRKPSRVPKDVRRIWGLLVGLVAMAVLLFGLKMLVGNACANVAIAAVGIALILAVAMRVLTLRMMAGLLALLAIAAYLFWLWKAEATTVAGSVVAVLSCLAGFVLHKFLLPYFGDVARYVRAMPFNIAGRQAVRQRGIELLTRLHDEREGDSYRYDRLVVAAHSLGTIVAFDLIAHLWAEREEATKFWPGDADGMAALKAVEAATEALQANPNAGDAERRQLQEAQRALFKAMSARAGETDRDKARRWIVSDFVTVGSPLAHGNFLLARDEADFKRRQKDREILRCPPVTDRQWPSNLMARKAAGIPLIGPTPGFEPDGTSKGEKVCGLFYRFGKSDKAPWRLHHAAPFAVVRWTNIYDRDKNGDRLKQASLDGDLISGPCAPHYGRGVWDYQVKLTRPDRKTLKPRIFTHTDYWTLKPPAGGSEHLALLRQGLDLQRKTFGYTPDVKKPAVAQPSAANP